MAPGAPGANRRILFFLLLFLLSLVLVSRAWSMHSQIEAVRFEVTSLTHHHGRG